MFFSVQDASRKRRVFTISPTILAVTGLVFYLLERNLILYVKSFDGGYGTSHPDPEGSSEKITMYVCTALPMWLFIVACPVYIFLMYHAEDEDAQRVKGIAYRYTPMQHGRAYSNGIASIRA